MYKELSLCLESGPWMLDPWKYIIKNLFSSLQPCKRVLTYLCTFLLCHCMFNVSAISSVCSWRWWQVHNSTVKHVFLSPSAQLSKPNSHLSFFGRFHGSVSFNKTQKRKAERFKQGWELAKFATIVTVQIAVWHDARAKNNVKGVQHDVGSLQRDPFLHKTLCWQT